jgi:hypothetical protein
LQRWHLRTAVFIPHLALSNHVHKFNSSSRRRSGFETFEPKSQRNFIFDNAMVLLYDII